MSASPIWPGKPISPGKPVWIITRGGTAVPGGIARMVEYLTREWAASGRAPALHIQDSTGRFGKKIMPLFFAVAFARVALAGLAGRIALLHIHMSDYGSVARKGLMIHLGRLLGLPVVVHMHGAAFRDFWRRLPEPPRRAIRATLRRADRFIVLGASWRDFFVNEVGLDPARVVKLPNGVPAPAGWAPRPPPARPALLFLAVLEQRKGLSDLLAALAELRGGNWTLDIAGAGDPASYERLAVQLGLSGQVRFHGHQDDAGVRALLGRCDALVLPSYAEGLPMAILEAMAHGLAVVATPVGDIADAVTDGVSGLLVPPGNPPALAAALRRLIDDPVALRRMGANGRRRFEQDFEIGQVNARLAAIFAELLPAPSTAPARHAAPAA